VSLFLYRTTPECLIIDFHLKYKPSDRTRQNSRKNFSFLPNPAGPGADLTLSPTRPCSNVIPDVNDYGKKSTTEAKPLPPLYFKWIDCIGEERISISPCSDQYNAPLLSSID